MSLTEEQKALIDEVIKPFLKEYKRRQWIQRIIFFVFCAINSTIGALVILYASKK